MIYSDITELIGRTPLLEISGIDGQKARIAVKLESFNPGGSAKDRVALSMIVDAENKGLLKKGATIIEPTSGNTGVGLAMVGVSRGYKVILTMPDTMSAERRSLLAAYGAELVLTNGADGISGSIEKAEELHRNIPGSVIMGQFDNRSNPDAHYSTTGQEIWEDTEGLVDIFVAGVGTGGTITGTAKALKEHKPSIEVIGVEPAESAVLSGGKPGKHGLQGIGAGFIPKVYDPSLVDRIVPVSDDDAYRWGRFLARERGILSGITSGAAFSAAVAVAREERNVGRLIVALLPDTGERYLSTPLFR